MLEEPGFWGDNGFKYIHGRQTEFILVGDKKNYLGKWFKLLNRTDDRCAYDATHTIRIS